MNEELTIAIEQLRLYRSQRTWFIPILLDPITPPDRSIGAGESLRDLQWVDLSKNWDQGIELILNAVLPVRVRAIGVSLLGGIITPNQAQISGIGIGSCEDEVKTALGSPLRVEKEEIESRLEYKQFPEGPGKRYFFKGIQLITLGGRVLHLFCRSPMYKTTSGLSVGDSLFKVFATHGVGERYDDSKGVDALVYSVENSEITMLFRFESNRVKVIEIGILIFTITQC
jgi:hypothetical protein